MHRPTIDSIPVQLHPRHPDLAWVVVLQPKAEPFRLAFDPGTRTFVTTNDPSHLHEHGFDGVYGWIMGLGEPPEPHTAAVVLTRADPLPGAVLEAAIRGIMLPGRILLGIDSHATPSHGTVDLTQLPTSTRHLLDHIQPRDQPTRWLAGRAAREHLEHGRRLTERSRPTAWPTDLETWETHRTTDTDPWPW